MDITENVTQQKVKRNINLLQSHKKTGATEEPDEHMMSVQCPVMMKMQLWKATAETEHLLRLMSEEGKKMLQIMCLLLERVMEEKVESLKNPGVASQMEVVVEAEKDLTTVL